MYGAVPQPVDARERPEVREHDAPAQLGLSKRVGVEPCRRSPRTTAGADARSRARHRTAGGRRGTRSGRRGRCRPRSLAPPALGAGATKAIEVEPPCSRRRSPARPPDQIRFELGIDTKIATIPNTSSASRAQNRTAVPRGQVAAGRVPDRAETRDERARGAGRLPERGRIGLRVPSSGPGPQRQPQQQAEAEQQRRLASCSRPREEATLSPMMHPNPAMKKRIPAPPLRSRPM